MNDLRRYQQKNKSRQVLLLFRYVIHSFIIVLYLTVRFFYAFVKRNEHVNIFFLKTEIKKGKNKRTSQT